ncbi:MAG: four-carbon acid sugar kinase family protein [Anaerolineae bacterium]
MPTAIRKSHLLDVLPPAWPEDLLPDIQRKVQLAGSKIVVLDDDPTGNQTVHGVDVLTGWEVPALVQAFRKSEPVVYVLTNSRSVPAPVARVMNREIAANLKAARAATERDFVVVSRSDSTLRGHYPAEIEALAEALDRPVDATLIIPFFIEGGRITAGDAHYVTEGETLIPAAETEYARDPIFGYQNSNLRRWVSEKHGGDIPPADVASITLDDIRTGGPELVGAKLAGLSGGRVCVVNAVCYRDLEVVVSGLLNVERAGKHFLYRTAASFVRVRGGIIPQPLLTHTELTPPEGGGLVVVGSHVQKTTRQVVAAEAETGAQSIEVSVAAVLDEDRRDAEITRVVDQIERTLRSGDDALVCTSREVITEAEGLSGLEIGQLISSALVAIVARLQVRPAWMIAKGGITSSDLATGGLHVHRARVLGQAIPGVPVWRTGEESLWPGLIYVVFPGNVGDDQALADMIMILRGDA